MTERQRKPKPLTRAQIKEGLNTIPMDTLILGTATEARLTPKQREFARLVALGESKAQSYRKAYNSKGNVKTVANKGYQLSQRDDIQTTMAAFAEAQRFAESHTPAQLRAFVIQQLSAHAANEENPPAVRIKALELIGKHSGVDSFSPRQVEITHHKSGDIRSRIMDKLKLIGASTTIEVNSIQDDAQDADSLLQELTEVEPDPIPDEIPQDDTHRTQPPPELGVESGDDTHTIPYTQSTEIPIPSSTDDEILTS